MVVASDDRLITTRTLLFPSFDERMLRTYANTSLSAVSTCISPLRSAGSSARSFSSRRIQSSIACCFGSRLMNAFWLHQANPLENRADYQDRRRPASRSHLLNKPAAFHAW